MRANAGRAVFAVAVLALLLSGCFLWPRNRDDSVYEPAPISVAVENRSWNHVTIYVVAGSARSRLGDLVATSSAEFELPGMFTTRMDLRLVVSPLASRQVFRTDQILVAPGETIHLVVENVLRMSTWTVRGGRAEY
jgi:hypothetical protein